MGSWTGKGSSSGPNKHLGDLDRNSALRLSPLQSLQNLSWLFVGVFAAGYVLFQKKLLPFKYARFAAKIFFWPTIPLTIMNRWTNYWTAIDNTLIMGAAPIAPLGHVESLRDLGVTGVVNLCDEYRGPVKAYNKYGIDELYIPTVDHFEPTAKDLAKAVSFIKDRQAKGEKAFVHCKAGHGRSAAVALCWLITQNPGASPQLLNQKLGEKRKVRKTLYKQNCVRTFAKEYGSGKR